MHDAPDRLVAGSRLRRCDTPEIYCWRVVMTMTPLAPRIP